MNLYIWQETRPVSYKYHCGGGLAVVAATLDEARAHAKRQLTAEDVDCTNADWLQDPPDRTYRLDTSTDEFDVDPDDVYPPEVLTFPNAGCC